MTPLTAHGAAVKKKAVLHVLDPEPNGNIGGADLHVIDLASSQNLVGLFDPVVLLLTDAPLVSERLRRCSVTVIDGYSMGKRYTELPFILKEAIGALEPAVIHSHGYDANYFSCWARLGTRGPWSRPRLIFTSHGWIDEPSLFIKTQLDLLTHRFADHVIICSPHQFHRAQRATGRKNVTFISNGLPDRDTAKIDRTALEARLSIPRTRRLIAFVGRLSPEKRVSAFLEIAHLLVPLFADIHFLIVGGGPLKNELRSQVELLGLTQFVTMTGVVPDIDSIYQHLELLVLPSATETTSRVTIEAMLWGLPVVASNVGGLPSLITSGQDGFLCPPRDIRSFVDYIGLLLTNPEQRKLMGTVARQKALSLFGLESMRRKVEAVYLNA